MAKHKKQGAAKEKKEGKSVIEIAFSVMALIISMMALILTIMSYLRDNSSNNENTYYQDLTYTIEAEPADNELAESRLGVLTGSDVNVQYDPITGGIAKVYAILFRDGICRAVMPLEYAKEVNIRDCEAYSLSPLITQLSKEEIIVMPSTANIESESGNSMFCSAFLVGQDYVGNYSTDLLVMEYGLNDEGKLDGSSDFRIYSGVDMVRLINTEEGQAAMPAYDEKMLRLFSEVSETVRKSAE